MKMATTAALAFFLAGCASTHAIDPAIASTSFSGAEQLEVMLSNFDFDPSTVRMKAGMPYALHIINKASGGHDFTAPEFFGAAKIAPDDVALVRDGQINLAGGQSATVHLVPATGEYELVCTHTGHAVLGMKGKIIVS